MANVDRKLKILSVIVERYVATGEPIGSKSVCEGAYLPFSSATIRSEMANLAEAGYLDQPHISSGRVPSHQGYRLYINRLMHERPLLLEEKNLINGILCSAAPDPESLIEAAAKMLADITDFTAIITTPKNLDAKLKNIKFVSVSKSCAMIVLITSNGMVKNRLFQCEYELTDKLLNIFSTVLNEKFKGTALRDIVPESVSIMTGYNNETVLLMIPIIDALMKVAKDAREIEIKIEGQKNLLTIPGIKAENIINIYNFLEDKKSVLDLLMSEDRGIKFLIGEENPYAELKDASVIATKYRIGGKFGVIGIIGPTRMDYSGIATKLEYIAATIGALLGRILNQ